jgi:hypothetical protein
VRRLVLVVVSCAALGIGVVALSSSGHARAAVPRPPARPASLKALPAIPLPLAPYIVPSAQPRGRIVTRHAQLAPLASTSCFVGAGSCSIHPCAQFAGASSAVAITSQTMVTAPTVTLPRKSKPTCLPQAERVNERVATAQVVGSTSAPAALATTPKPKP